MISKATLDKAKAFLCWDRFPDLSIQLVAMQEAVAYFYPPTNRSTIIVYYNRGSKDFALPLFFLFHEAGHYIQYIDMDNPEQFDRMMNLQHGREKQSFEKTAWLQGRKLLNEFIEKENLDTSFLSDYDIAKQKSLKTYKSTTTTRGGGLQQT